MFTKIKRAWLGSGSGLYLASCVSLLLVLSFSLSSCQTITRIKCNSKDWTKVGQKDGAAGKRAENTFLTYYDECSASGAEIDKTTYMTGYQGGLGTFCTLKKGESQARDGHENQNLCMAKNGSAFDEGFTLGLAQLCDSAGGQNFGLSGGIYRGTCPSDTEQEFLTSYLNALGSALPQSIADVTILEVKSTSLQSDINSLESELSKYDNAIESAKKSNNKIWQEQLESDRSNISNRLFTLRMDQRRTEDDLADARKKSRNLQNMLLEWKMRLDV